MAISKTQNERPAIIALVDAMNETEPIVAQNVQDIATLTENLGNEISNRQSADEQLQADIVTLTENLGNEISNRQSADEQLQADIGMEVSNRITADTNIQNQIGNGFNSNNTVANVTSQLLNSVNSLNTATVALQSWQNRFRLGLTSDMAIGAGASTSDSLTFATPFDSDAEVGVFPVCVNGNGVLTDLSCELISATYSGFSFAISNNSQTAATVKVGFLAVRMN